MIPSHHALAGRPWYDDKANVSHWMARAARMARMGIVRLQAGGYVSAVLAVAVMTAAGWPLAHWFAVPNENILMLYLLAVLWTATRHHRGAAVVASLLGVAAFDYVFVPPYYTFAVSDPPRHIVTFAVMLTTALVISALTSRVREQGEAARHRERRTSTLYALSRDMAAARSVQEIAAAVVRHVAEALGYRAAIYLPEPDRHLRLAADSSSSGGAVGSAVSSTAAEIAMAQEAFDHERDSETFAPLRASRGTVGVMGVFSGEPLAGEARQLLESLCSQAALALERAALAEEAKAAWERVEAEFLRNTLLSGVSHELRTPLAAIAGSASAIVEAGERLPAETRNEMLETITAESERMDRLINNLLDMTRLESGGLMLKREWQPIQEVIGSALRHLDRRLEGREVKIDIAEDTPMVKIDSVAIEQVLTNLIDNAVEYTAGGIEVSAARRGNGLVVAVADHGPGLAAGTEARVLEKFFRIRPAENRRGIGLGLAIAKGIIDAHGGTIAAHNRDSGGAVFEITIPVTGNPPSVNGTE